MIRPDGAVDDVACPVRARRASGRIALPGFVDLQVNGAGGVAFATATADEVRLAAATLASTGVVAFQPTLYSSTVGEYLAALGVLAQASDALVLGAHLEGPFLSPSWAGAHDPGRLVNPDVEVVDRLCGAGPVAMMTIAPELDGAVDVVREARRRGIRVAVGHTDADADTVRAALDAGASMLTHGFNAHRRFTARDPGPAGVALTDARCHVGLICDLVHVAPETVRLAFAAAGERVVAVTDAVVASTVPGAVRDGHAVRTRAGVLAGTTLSMDQSLRNVIATGVDVAAAVAAHSTTPARLSGLGRHDLTPGSTARAVVVEGCVDDGDWVVVGPGAP